MIGLGSDKNISGNENDDSYDDGGGEDDGDNHKVDDLDDGVEDIDDYDEDKPEVQQQSLLPKQPLS